MEEYSPQSDRLVIDWEEQPTPKSPSEIVTDTTVLDTTDTSPYRKPSAVSHQTTVNEPDTRVARASGQAITDRSCFKQIFQAIHESIALYPGTTLDASIARLSDIIQHHELIRGSLKDLVTNKATLSVQHASVPTNCPSINSLTDESARAISKRSRSPEFNDDPAPNVKPPYVYSGLILMAIHSSEQKMLTLQGIREKLRTWFPFFNGDNTNWHDTVRHTLSNKQCFYQIHSDNKSRNKYWAIDYEYVRPEVLVRRHIRRQSSQVQYSYKYNLHEQLGLPPLVVPEADRKRAHVIPSYKNNLHEQLDLTPSVVPDADRKSAHGIPSYKYNLHEQLGVPPMAVPEKNIMHEGHVYKCHKLSLPPKPTVSTDCVSPMAFDTIFGRLDDALLDEALSYHEHTSTDDSIDVQMPEYTYTRCPCQHKRKVCCDEPSTDEVNRKRRRNDKLTSLPSDTLSTNHMPATDHVTNSDASETSRSQSHIRVASHGYSFPLERSQFGTDAYFGRKDYPYTSHPTNSSYGYKQQHPPILPHDQMSSSFYDKPHLYNSYCHY